MVDDVATQNEPIIHALLRTTDFRGDHESDIAIACEVDPSETVENLVRRLLESDQHNINVAWIELRIAREAR